MLRVAPFSGAVIAVYRFGLLLFLDLIDENPVCEFAVLGLDGDLATLAGSFLVIFVVFHVSSVLRSC